MIWVYQFGLSNQFHNLLYWKCAKSNKHYSKWKSYGKQIFQLKYLNDGHGSDPNLCNGKRGKIFVVLEVNVIGLIVVSHIKGMYTTLVGP